MLCGIQVPKIRLLYILVCDKLQFLDLAWLSFIPSFLINNVISAKPPYEIETRKRHKFQFTFQACYNLMAWIPLSWTLSGTGGFPWLHIFTCVLICGYLCIFTQGYHVTYRYVYMHAYTHFLLIQIVRKSLNWTISLSHFT